jgi:hypothetical protein
MDVERQDVRVGRIAALIELNGQSVAAYILAMYGPGAWEQARLALALGDHHARRARTLDYLHAADELSLAVARLTLLDALACGASELACFGAVA